MFYVETYLHFARNVSEMCEHKKASYKFIS
jgi:hypothetical protein